MYAVIQVNSEGVPYFCKLFNADEKDKALDLAIEIVLKIDRDLESDCTRDELENDGYMYVANDTVAILLTEDA